MDMGTLTLSTGDDMEVGITREGKHVLFQFYDSGPQICVFDSEAELGKYLWSLAPTDTLGLNILGQSGAHRAARPVPGHPRVGRRQMPGQLKVGSTRRRGDSNGGPVARRARTVR